MNIGPKADGTIFSRERQIIGDWKWIKED